MTAVGERVGAILSVNDNEVQFLGYGVYEGPKLRPNWRQEAHAILPIQREVFAEEAAKTVDKWLHWYTEMNDLVRNTNPGEERTGEELHAAAVDAHAQAQMRLHWPDDQLIEWLKESSSLLVNSRIKLDNGETVWGMECWWGPEEKIQGILAIRQEGGATITTVRLPSDRYYTT